MWYLIRTIIPFPKLLNLIKKEFKKQKPSFQNQELNFIETSSNKYSNKEYFQIPRTQIETKKKIKNRKFRNIKTSFKKKFSIKKSYQILN